jgi:hypothetical protein
MMIEHRRCLVELHSYDDQEDRDDDPGKRSRSGPSETASRVTRLFADFV